MTEPSIEDIRRACAEFMGCIFDGTYPGSDRFIKGYYTPDTSWQQFGELWKAVSHHCRVRFDDASYLAGGVVVELITDQLQPDGTTTDVVEARAEAPTPQLALCRAVHKLQENENG